MNDSIKILSGGAELLDRIAPLWGEIKQYHVEKSRHFSKDLDSISFEKRKRGLISKAKYLRVDIANNLEMKKDVGYCISTIDNNNRGEIDSLYIEASHRRQGIGKQLTKMALTWLDKEGASESSIVVAYGNEKACDFYKIFGFYPRNIQLSKKKKGKK